MERIAPISVTYKFVGYINYRGDNKICNLSFSTNVRGQLLYEVMGQHEFNWLNVANVGEHGIWGC